MCWAGVITGKRFLGRTKVARFVASFLKRLETAQKGEWGHSVWSKANNIISYDCPLYEGVDPGHSASPKAKMYEKMG